MSIENINILAVSDIESSTLQTLLHDISAIRGKIDLLISCGDLRHDYLSFLADTLNLELLYVFGNHDLYQKKSAAQNKTDSYGMPTFSARKGFPGTNLSGKLIQCSRCIITGFEGSRWYNGQGIQYHEKEMLSSVKKTMKKIRLRKIIGKIARQKKMPFLVVSHAPVQGIHDLDDQCHKGFSCFKKFIDKIQPALWLHGHIHQPSLIKNQISVYKHTTIVNVCEYRFISISEAGRVRVSHQFQKI
ncbi:MAG: metallophosphoesterase [Candidatus Aureabacteria bacterium]|nr:metallophosphoesterase [Candidatus Auribacterota bacterium]